MFPACVRVISSPTTGTSSAARHKDTDARWAMKGDYARYGYKGHAKVDWESKIITAYSVTSASLCNSIEFVVLVDDKDKAMHADSAYLGVITVRSIRIVRARCWNVLKNLAYNLHRASYLTSKSAAA